MPFANTYYKPWKTPPARPRRPLPRMRPPLPPKTTKPVIWLACYNAPAPIRH